LRQKNLVPAADSEQEATPAAAFKSALASLHSEESVGDVRGLGLLWAVEFVADKNTKRPFPADSAFSSKVAAAALKGGLLVYPMQGSVDGTSGDHILLAPPAIITAEQISWSLEQLSASIREAQKQL
jgi:adenosylmethionine-8-amino-7-oxononanoate aminotransferase